MAVGDRLAREVMEQSTVGAQKILNSGAFWEQFSAREEEAGGRNSNSRSKGSGPICVERSYHNLVKSGPEELFCFQGLFCYLKFPHLLLHSAA